MKTERLAQSQTVGMSFCCWYRVLCSASSQRKRLPCFQYFQFDSFDQQYSGLADFINALKVKVLNQSNLEVDDLPHIGLWSGSVGS